MWDVDLLVLSGPLQEHPMCYGSPLRMHTTEDKAGGKRRKGLGLLREADMGGCASVSNSTWFGVLTVIVRIGLLAALSACLLLSSASRDDKSAQTNRADVVPQGAAQSLRAGDLTSALRAGKISAVISLSETGPMLVVYCLSEAGSRPVNVLALYKLSRYDGGWKLLDSLEGGPPCFYGDIQVRELPVEGHLVVFTSTAGADIIWREILLVSDGRLTPLGKCTYEFGCNLILYPEGPQAYIDYDGTPASGGYCELFVSQFPLKKPFEKVYKSTPDPDFKRQAFACVEKYALILKEHFASRTK